MKYGKMLPLFPAGCEGELTGADQAEPACLLPEKSSVMPAQVMANNSFCG